MVIVLGSTSKEKKQALRSALVVAGSSVMDVVPVAAGSGTHAQPLGLDQMVFGARNRAKEALVLVPHADLAVAVENGITMFGERCMDFAAVLAVSAKDGAERWAFSTAIEFPREMADEAWRRGFDETTVGSVVAEKLGGSPQDPHRTLLKGAFSREDLLVPALVSVLLPFLPEKA